MAASAQSPKHPSGQTPVSRSHVLHLSDLHFSSPDQAIAWQSQLASDLKHELRVSSLSALVVSGDIANTAEPVQYETASRFLQELGGEFGLTPQQIVLVPGNHDVGWKQSKRAYIPMRRDDYEGPLDSTTHISEGKYIELRDDALYQLRFESFARFYESVRTEDYPLEYSDQATIHHFPEQDLLFVGMNSAWHIDHHFKERAGLHPGAVSRALSQIRTTPDYATCVKFAVFHHPPEQFQESAGFDASVLEQLVQAGFQFVMHGHIHAAHNELFRYDRSVAGRKLEVLGAGTFGAPTHELRHGYPFQYQLLDITSRTLTVHTRRREEVAVGDLVPEGGHVDAAHDREVGEVRCHEAAHHRPIGHVAASGLDEAGAVAVRAGVTAYVEVGPGTVLSGLVKKIAREAVILNLDAPEGLAPIEALAASGSAHA